MTERKRYLKNVKKEFQFLGNSEKKYLKNLELQIINYADNNDVTYDQLTNRFGEPKEIVLSYYENVENADLLKKIKWKKIITIILIIVIIIAILAIITFIFTYIDSQSQNIDNTEVIIETLK